MICVASARHKMVCVSKMRFCATQRAPRRVDKAENSPRLYKKYPGTVPAFCVILGYLLRIAPKFSGCLAVPSRLPPLASGLLPIRPPQRGKRR